MSKNCNMFMAVQKYKCYKPKQPKYAIHISKCNRDTMSQIDAKSNNKQHFKSLN